jgi:hypothetical protein
MQQIAPVSHQRFGAEKNSGASIYKTKRHLVALIFFAL